MNLINKGDILESYTKAKQRGVNYFFSKINPNPRKRTQSTFNPEKSDGSNWWIVPAVKQRENEKLAGDPQKTFDIHLSENYFAHKSDLKLLSVACGVGNREIRMAESGHFNEVLGIDLSGESIREASQKVNEKQLNNIRFEQADFYSFDLKENYYNVIMFYSSLHHFKNIDLIAQRISKSLKSDGYLVLNEYVGKNRLQFPKEQVREMNRLLKTIPDKYRTRFLTNQLKRKVYAPGLLRMIISDPSEAVESETIRPNIHNYFSLLEERKIGGDLLMMVLKDISHHFVIENDAIGKQILEQLFQEEDRYLRETENADFIFGVYQKK